MQTKNTDTIEDGESPPTPSCRHSIHHQSSLQTMRFTTHCCRCKFSSRVPENHLMPFLPPQHSLICGNRSCKHRICDCCVEDVQHLYVSCWSCEREVLVDEVIECGSITTPNMGDGEGEVVVVRCRRCQEKMEWAVCGRRWRSVYSTLGEVMGNTQSGLAKMVKRRGLEMGVYVRWVGEKEAWRAWR
ncbi:hypothetical protein EX30DRAFT_158353 [Ascodesmis nigricans]|uniref:Uncharacterized protein n=1 Tax=Ascodesmis nigricans TaxID=341454 RepID=A0A4S2MN15_9PEZI|nr:hypothetical protein EX30DRAFT_158353 [Ascodesmis nigricans]